MQIKRLGQTDTTESIQCCEILKKGYPDYLHPYLIYFDSAYLGYFKQTLKNDDSWIFVAGEKGIVFGFTQFKIMNDVLFLNSIMIDPEYQNKKIAKTLFRHSVHEIHLKYTNLSDIYLDVFGKNVKAFTWYERMGFTKLEDNYWYNILDTLPEEQKENRLLFKKDLNGFEGYYSDDIHIASLINNNCLIFRNEMIFNEYKLNFRRGSVKFAALISSAILDFSLIETSVRMGYKINSLFL